MTNNIVFIYGFLFYLCINGVLIVMFFNGLYFCIFICLVFLVVGFPPLLFYIHDFSSFSSNKPYIGSHNKNQQPTTHHPLAWKPFMNIMTPRLWMNAIHVGVENHHGNLSKGLRIEFVAS